MRESALEKLSMIEDIIITERGQHSLNYCPLSSLYLFCVGDEKLIAVFIFEGADSILTFF